MKCPNCKIEAGTAKFCPECWALVYLETEVFPEHKPVCAQENEAVLECEHLPSEFQPAEPVPAPPAAPPAKPAAAPAAAEPAKICPHCKSLLPANATFCGRCGKQIGAQMGQPAYRPPPQPQNPAPAKPAAAAQAGCLTLMMMIGGLITAVVLCCAAFLGQ